MNLHELDSQYSAFAPFDQWRGHSLEMARWERYASEIAELAGADPETLRRARHVVRRVAAVETGAIESLYDTDRGFTFSVAVESATWEAALAAKGSAARSLITSQLAAYEYVLDFATHQRPVVEAWLRELHSIMCDGQETYLVHTAAGPQPQLLSKGAYKVHPNHVIQQDGTVHVYCPVDFVVPELQRLCAELATLDFVQAPPVHKAAYAHYALVALHPFADGNGRVARALASVFLYQAISTPLLIFAEHRAEYFSALRRADQEDFGPFLEFVYERALDAMQLVITSIETARAPEPHDTFGSLRALFHTKGGYSHPQVDTAGQQFIDTFALAFNDLAQQFTSPEVVFDSHFDAWKNPPSAPHLRVPVEGGGRVLLVRFSSKLPAIGEIVWRFVIEVPRDCGRHDDLLITCVDDTSRLTARMLDIAASGPSAGLHVRMRMYQEGIIGKMLNRLIELGQRSLKKRGYP